MGYRGCANATIGSSAVKIGRSLERGSGFTPGADYKEKRLRSTLVGLAI